LKMVHDGPIVINVRPAADRRGGPTLTDGSLGTELTVGKMNAEWHRANRMPARATLDQRVSWHLSHLKACGCRTDLPQTIVAELKSRRIKLPRPKAP